MEDDYWKAVNFKIAIDKSTGIMHKKLKVEELCKQLTKEGLTTKDHLNNIMVIIILVFFG